MYSDVAILCGEHTVSLRMLLKINMGNGNACSGVPGCYPDWQPQSCRSGQLLFQLGLVLRKLSIFISSDKNNTLEFLFTLHIQTYLSSFVFGIGLFPLPTKYSIVKKFSELLN